MKENNEKSNFTVLEKLRLLSSKFFSSQTKVMVVSGVLGILLFITATVFSISTGYYNLDASFQNNDSKLSLTEDIAYTAGKNYNTNSQIPENNKVTETNDSDIQSNNYSSVINSSNVSSMVDNVQSIPDISSQDTQNYNSNGNNTISNNNTEIYTSESELESVSTYTSSNLDSEQSSDISNQDNIINESSIIPENSSNPPEIIKININTATYDELVKTLPISDLACERIIEYMQLNGPFESIDELLNIEGIGKGALESIRELITV